MHRAVELLGGGLLGFFLGTSFLATPLASAFESTQVIWNAGTCPTGVYRVTSTARNLVDGREYSTTAVRVRLPQTELRQAFDALPAGDFSVTAVAERADGATFQSESQIITNSTTAISSDSRRRESQEQIGVAGTRTTSAGASKTAATAQPNVAQAPRTRQALQPRSLTREVLQQIRDVLAVIVSVRNPDQDSPSRIDGTDEDGDGVLETVAISWPTGERWLVRIHQ